MEDKFVQAVVDRFRQRSDTGQKNDDLNILEWLNHLQEELMDAALYVEKLKSEVENTIDEDTWQKADKITHDGYVYVKYNDLKFNK